MNQLFAPVSFILQFFDPCGYQAGTINPQGTYSLYMCAK